MSKRKNNDVTLSHSDALALEKILSDHHSQNRTHANRTKNAVVRETLQAQNKTISELHAKIIDALWTWA